MTNRFARTIDRMHVISDLKREANTTDLARYDAQLDILWKRANLTRTAISLAAAAALLAAVMVIVIFGGALLQLHIVTTIVLLFAACMTSLSASLIYFLRDINLALNAVEVELKFDSKRGK